MEVSSRRLAIVQHRHLPARGLLSLFSLLRAFLLTAIKRNQGAVLALTAANSTPGECLSVARYRFLHHTAVSFVSSDIRVF